MSSSGGRIFAGIALIALAFFTGGSSMAAWGTSAKMMAGVGVNLLLGEAVARMTKPDADQSSVREVRSVVRGGYHYHHLVFGRTRVGGVLHFLDAHAVGQSHIDNRAHAVVAHSLTHKAGIHKLGGAWFDEFPILEPFIDANGDIIDGKFEGFGNIRSYIGTDTQEADPELRTFFWESWDENAWGRGIAYSAYYATMPDQNADDEAHDEFRELFSKGFPTLNREVFGIKCYDPREAGHDPDDPFTWEWSDNPAICAGTYLIMKRSDGGWGWPHSLIDWDSVAAAANICDETISAYVERETDFDPGNAVNIARYRCSVAVSTGDRLSENLSKILDSMAGVLVGPGATGKAQIHAGAYDPPEHVIDDRWVRGGDDSTGALEAILMTEIQELFNTPSVVYTQPIHGYGPTTARIKKHPDYVEQDGDEEIFKELHIPSVDNEYRAQYLALLWARKSRFQRVLRVPTNARGLAVAPWDVVTIDLDNENLDGEYRVVAVEDDDDSMPVLVLGEESPTAYSWNLGDAVPATIEDMEDAVFVPPPIPTNLQLTQIAPDRIRVQVDPVSPALVSKFEYERAYSLEDLSGPYTDDYVIKASFVGRLTIDEFDHEEAQEVSSAVPEIFTFESEGAFWYRVRATGILGDHSEWTNWVLIQPMLSPPVPVVQMLLKGTDSVGIHLEPIKNALVDGFEFERRVGDDKEPFTGGSDPLEEGSFRDYRHIDQVNFEDLIDPVADGYLWYRFRSIGLDRIFVSDWSSWHFVKITQDFLALSLSLRNVPEGIRLRTGPGRLYSNLVKEFERQPGTMLGPNGPITEGEFTSLETIDYVDHDDEDWMWYRIRPIGPIGEVGNWTSWEGIPAVREAPMPENLTVEPDGSGRVLTIDPIPAHLFDRIQFERVPGPSGGPNLSLSIALGTFTDFVFRDARRVESIVDYDENNSWLWYRVRTLAAITTEPSPWTAWVGIDVPATSEPSGAVYEGCGDPRELYPTVEDFIAAFGEAPTPGDKFVDLCGGEGEPLSPEDDESPITVEYTFIPQRGTIPPKMYRWVRTSSYGTPEEGHIGTRLRRPTDAARLIGETGRPPRTREEVTRRGSQGTSREPIHTRGVYDETGEDQLINTQTRRLGSALRAPNDTLMTSVEDGGNRAVAGLMDDGTGDIKVGPTRNVREVGANHTETRTSNNTSNVDRLPAGDVPRLYRIGSGAATSRGHEDNIRQGRQGSTLGPLNTGGVYDSSGEDQLIDPMTSRISHFMRAPNNTMVSEVEDGGNRARNAIESDGIHIKPTTRGPNNTVIGDIEDGGNRALTAVGSDNILNRGNNRAVGTANRHSRQTHGVFVFNAITCSNYVITVENHFLRIGAQQIHYNTGTISIDTSYNNRTAHIYVDDPGFGGGSVSYAATRLGALPHSGDDRYYVGRIDIDGSGNGLQSSWNGAAGVQLQDG